MSSLNKVTLLGNVGNVDVKDLEGGRKLVQLSLATSDGYKKDGEWVDKTEWHKCVFTIPTLAERAATIGKGDKIYVEGSINTNTWTNKEGEKKEFKEISCVSFKMFSKNKNAELVNYPPNAVVKSADAGEDLPF